MSIKHFLFLVICVVGFVFSLSGQDLQQFPPDIKWKQIKTKNYRIVFPAGFEEEAQKAAQSAESLHLPLMQTLDTEKKKWPVLLSNTGSISNGYVTLAPRHSQWYAMPPQTTIGGPVDWFTMLAIHEGRHMVQFDHLDQGLTNFVGNFFGETGKMVMIMFSVPLWFFEGDAISMETAFSESGRGRLPEFSMHQRALRLSGKKFGYHKAYLGSYRDHLPNHYVLGYHLVADTRNHFPATVFSEINYKASRNGFSLIPYSKAYRKVTGLNISSYYKDAMSRYDQMWLSQWDGLHFSKAEIVSNPQKEGYTSYSFPVIGYKGRVIAYKDGIAHTPHIVMVDTATAYEERIVEIQGNEFISAGQKSLCWIENSLNKRFINENFADIVVYDIETAQKSRITSTGRYAWPVLSPDERQVMAVNTDKLQRTSIEILDVSSKEVKMIIDAGPEYRYRQPAWSPQGDKIVTLRDGANGVAMVMIDLEARTETVFMPESSENICNPHWAEGIIFYGSPYSGIDNIYAFEIETGRHYQVSSRMFGAFYPYFDKQNQLLYFSDFTADGFQIVKAPIHKDEWVAKEDVVIKDVYAQYAETLASQENGARWMEKNREQGPAAFEVLDYHPAGNFNNVHSWSILPTINGFYASINSNNLLNTFSAQIGGGYNSNEKIMLASGGFTYSGLRPVISASGGKSMRNFRPVGFTENIEGTEYFADMSVTFPQMQVDGIYTSYLSHGLIGGYRDFTGWETVEQMPQMGRAFGFAGYKFDAVRQRQSSKRDLKPKYSWMLSAQVSNSFQKDKIIDFASFDFAYILPGLGPHDALTLDAAFEYQNYINYYRPSGKVLPRGHHYMSFRDVSRIGLAYDVPLFYPDLALGSFMYIKRVRAGLFADYAWSVHRKYVMSSVGVDLNFDTNLLSILILEIPIGVRFSYQPFFGTYGAELLLFNMSL